MNGNLAYKEEPWEERISGNVVRMSPRPVVNHNRIARNISRIFENYLEDRKCEAFGDGTDLYLTEEDRFVPDGMVVCDSDKIHWNGVYGAPDLVIEVLSPSTARYDRGHKKNVYARCGVKEYWIVDPGNRTVEQYLLKDGHFVLEEVYTLYPDFMLAAMTEEERAKVVTEFRCSLFPELPIRLKAIFAKTV